MNDPRNDPRNEPRKWSKGSRCWLVLTGSLMLAMSAPGCVAQEAKKPFASQAASAKSEVSDPILTAMKEELQRSTQKLRLPDLQAPYYIEYSLDDIEQFSGDAVFGAIRAQQNVRTRILRAVVRVGDYNQDSYSDREGVVEFAPLDNDDIALRHQLWIATDEAYKSALQSLARKQAALKQYQTEQTAPDFSHETPVVRLEPLSKIDLDTSRWTGMLEQTSGLYRADPRVDLLEATLQARSLNRYFVNSEGTTTRIGKTLYEAAVIGSTQADDGMNIVRSQPYVVANASELPGWEQLKHDTETLLGTLKDLRSAPLVEDEYQGPVLFSGDAASSTFAFLLAKGVSATKPAPGTNARTQGAFASSLKSRILPDTFSIIDDPTVASYRGHSLVGSYSTDDEGVSSRPVTIVDKGQLVNFLIGREPIRDFTASNGHGRAMPGGAPSAQIGVLFVHAAQTSSPDELKAKLIALCKEQGKPYGYYVETTGPRLTPRLLYRIYVEGGKKELVRGAAFSQLDTRALRNDIVAVGNDEFVDNSSDTVPETVVSPSILFGELMVKRANPSQEKLPVYPPPSLSNKSSGAK